MIRLNQNVQFQFSDKRETNDELDRSPIDAFKEKERKNVRFDTRQHVLGEGN